MRASFASWPLLLVLVLVGVLTSACDSVGSEDTAIFNANSAVPPTVEYDFRFNSSEAADGVMSENADNLASVLDRNGFSRADIVSARVDSVVLVRRSSLRGKKPERKVFEYLTGAEVFLGTDDNGPRIADDNFSTDNRRVSLQVSTRDVTQTIREGSTRAFLRLDTENNPDREDRVEVTVHYRIEARL